MVILSIWFLNSHVDLITLILICWDDNYFQLGLRWGFTILNVFSTTMIVKYIFLCGSEKLAFRKNIITIEPPLAIYACSDSIYLFIALLCYLASIFHVLTRFGLQHIMLQTFQTKSKVC